MRRLIFGLVFVGHRAPGEAKSLPPLRSCKSNLQTLRRQSRKANRQARELQVRGDVDQGRRAVTSIVLETDLASWAAQAQRGFPKDLKSLCGLARNTP